MPDPTGSDKTECEIEITPEMIAAGAAELAASDPRFQGYEDIAEEVFLAMWRLVKRAPSSAGGV
jgi:hypothetical protein